MKNIITITILICSFITNSFSQIRLSNQAHESFLNGNINKLTSIYKKSYDNDSNSVSTKYIDYLIHVIDTTEAYQIRNAIFYFEIFNDKFNKTNQQEKVEYCQKISICEEKNDNTLKILINKYANKIIVTKDTSEAKEFNKKYKGTELNNIIIEFQNDYYFKLISQNRNLQTIEVYKNKITKNQTISIINKIKDSLCYENAVKENSLGKYKDYLAQFPQGTFIDYATEKIIDIEFNPISETENIELIKEFEQKYPNNKYSKINLEKIGLKEWELSVNKIKLRDLIEFESKYAIVSNKFRKLIDNKRDTLLYHELILKNDTQDIRSGMNWILDSNLKICLTNKIKKIEIINSQHNEILNILQGQFKTPKTVKIFESNGVSKIQITSKDNKIFNFNSSPRLIDGNNFRRIFYTYAGYLPSINCHLIKKDSFVYHDGYSSQILINEISKQIFPIMGEVVDIITIEEINYIFYKKNTNETENIEISFLAINNNLNVNLKIIHDGIINNPIKFTNDFNLSKRMVENGKLKQFINYKIFKTDSFAEYGKVVFDFKKDTIFANNDFKSTSINNETTYLEFSELAEKKIPIFLTGKSTSTIIKDNHNSVYHEKKYSYNNILHQVKGGYGEPYVKYEHVDLSSGMLYPIKKAVPGNVLVHHHDNKDLYINTEDWCFFTDKPNFGKDYYTLENYELNNLFLINLNRALSDLEISTLPIELSDYNIAKLMLWKNLMEKCNGIYMDDEKIVTNFILAHYQKINQFETQRLFDFFYRELYYSKIKNHILINKTNSQNLYLNLQVRIVDYSLKDNKLFYTLEDENVYLGNSFNQKEICGIYNNLSEFIKLPNLNF
jgi:hypothetical protein